MVMLDFETLHASDLLLPGTRLNYSLSTIDLCAIDDIEEVSL